MDANDFAARLAVMEAAVAKCGKRDIRKRDDVEWTLPSVQSAASKEQAEVERALPSVEVAPKEQPEVVRIVPTVQSLVPPQEASEAGDISIVLAARIDRLDVQLDVINDLLRRLIADQAPTAPPRL
jgi:hypothetical protein